MELSRFNSLARRFAKLRVAVVGDFCLDRYLEIDPAKSERSIETGLPVHNVVNVRSQPGGAGTILNNLVALGVREIFPVGFAGDDGEGFELGRALESRSGVNLDHFIITPLRQTFTYTKPLVIARGNAPRELNRLDRKNWSPTPRAVQTRLAASIAKLAGKVDAMVLLDQVDLAGTGVITPRVLQSVHAAVASHPKLTVMADSRRSLRGYPPVCLKMNRAELCRLLRKRSIRSLAEVRESVARLARAKRRPCFVTLAERGIVAAAPDGSVEHLPAQPTRGEIDIVGAGDAVTANLSAALAVGADLREAIELANAAASIVIHQLGTTGTASAAQLRTLLFG